MECQSGARSGAAPAGISAADMSACLPVSVGQGSLVTEDQREVCPLSGRVISPGGSKPLSARLYGPAFAFSLLLYPPPYRLLLRVAFPCGEDDGLTTFRRCAQVGRSQLSAGGASSASGD